MMPVKPVVTANLYINGDNAGSTQFVCGETSVWIHRNGTVTGLLVGSGDSVAYHELETIIEGIVSWAQR